MCVACSSNFGEGPTLVASQYIPAPMSVDSKDSVFSYDTHNRRRSVDVGGLALALGAVSLGGESTNIGKGWGGWEDNELQGALYVLVFLTPFSLNACTSLTEEFNAGMPSF